MRIVQLANLVTPTSGGIRTVLSHLAAGYADRGHERHLILPGPRLTRRIQGDGSIWTVPAPRLPGSGGYRIAVRRADVAAILTTIRPDVIEVSDRYTLTWTAAWARARGVRSVALVHDHLGENLATWLPTERLVRSLADHADRRLVEDFDAVVCASRTTARPFGDAATVVPLGVDLEVFRPPARPRSGERTVRLLLVSRLSREKRPYLAIAALRVLLRQGVDASLTVVGDGPMRPMLEREAGRWPLRLLGHVADRARLADVMRDADVTLSTCPSEGFGLAALESLACGTPVVAVGGGPAELLAATEAPAGVGAVTLPYPVPVAEAVSDLVQLPPPVRSGAARALAERHPWDRTVAGLLAVHEPVLTRVGAA